MTTDGCTTDARPFSFIERQKENALAQMREQAAEDRRIADLVLGPNRNRRRHATTVIRLGNDYLVEVTEDDNTMWTAVVNGKRTNTLHHTQEDAILHLIAARYDPNPNSSTSAAFYAGRVLGIPANTN